MRLIDADALLENLQKGRESIFSVVFYKRHKEELERTLKSLINTQPTIEAVPVVHGKWIKEEPDEHGNRKPKCPVCGEYHLTSWSDYIKCKFCPSCGADMRKGGAE